MKHQVAAPVDARARSIGRRHFYSLFVSTAFMALSAPVLAQSAPPQAPPGSSDNGEIIVTARQRQESLIRVPVAVTALDAKAIARYNSDSLTKIAEMTPTVIISDYGVNGGGSLSIRGISSPASQVGFEQSVSVALDGVQVSNGRLAQLGYFDVKQVQILKGPQALFFGKNSPAGVISIASADPSSHVEGAMSARYEFVSDERVIEGHVSGPITQTLSGRFALRYRNMEGWVYNNAQAMPNPFNATLPLTGASNKRPGNSALTGRATLKFEPGNRFDATLKIMGDQYRSDPTSHTQVIGCPGSNANIYGHVDPNADCVANNQTSIGNVPALLAQAMYGASTDGHPFDNTNTGMASLIANYKADKFTLTSSTGYISWKTDFFSGFDQTGYSELAVSEHERFHAFSQEFRGLTKFDGPLNAMLGAYYQDTRETDRSPVSLSEAGFNPTTGAFTGYDKSAWLTGSTYSLFGQAILNLHDVLEVAGGVRWTHEVKNMSMHNLYGSGSFNTLTTVYAGSVDQTPGVLAGQFSGSNWSPDATISYHPSGASTVYVAYKTGYKSGGFGVTNPQTTTTSLSGVSFGPEHVFGFETGFKGMLLDRHLRLELNVYDYNYKDLQVTSYNPALVAYTVSNAAQVKQKGIEFQADYTASDHLRLHGAVAYNHNRFGNFTGQCYGYSFPTGTTRATAVPPAGCSFQAATGLALQQNFTGRAPARSPDLSGNIGFEYRQPLADGDLTLNSDVLYSGGYYAAETMSPYSYQHSYAKLNASLRYAASNGGWDVALIGRNLTNKYVLLFSTDLTGGNSTPGAIGEQRGVVDRGREFSVQATFHFN